MLGVVFLRLVFLIYIVTLLGGGRMYFVDVYIEVESFEEIVIRLGS